MSAKSRFESSEPSTSEWAVNQDFFSISRKQMPDGFRGSTESSEAVHGGTDSGMLDFAPKSPFYGGFWAGQPHIFANTVFEKGERKEKTEI